MSDKVEEPCEVAVVSLDDLLDRVLRLKLRAIRKGDKETVTFECKNCNHFVLARKC